MNSKTKIKVDRHALIESIKDRQAAAEEEYRRQLREYRDAEAMYPQLVADYLDELAALVREGDLAPSEALSSSFRSNRPDPPDRPREPREPRNMNLAIMQLEIASDDTVTISGEDFAAYMS